MEGEWGAGAPVGALRGRPPPNGEAPGRTLARPEKEGAGPDGSPPHPRGGCKGGPLRG